MAEAPAIVWLRQDLRLADNPALAAAAETNRPLALLYILDDETPGRWRIGGASRWWLHHSLIELAKALECSEQDLDDDLQALHTSRMLSLDERYGDGDESDSLANQLRDGDSSDPGDNARDREDLQRLTRAIAELPETDRHVVVLYFHEQLYLKEIGTILGVTESRVSQILTRATERLRWKLKERE